MNRNNNLQPLSFIRNMYWPLIRAQPRKAPWALLLFLFFSFRWFHSWIVIQSRLSTNLQFRVGQVTIFRVFSISINKVLNKKFTYRSKWSFHFGSRVPLTIFVEKDCPLPSTTILANGSGSRKNSFLVSPLAQTTGKWRIQRVNKNINIIILTTHYLIDYSRLV